MAQSAMVVVPFASREHARFTPPPLSSTDRVSGLPHPSVSAEARKPKLLDQVREAIRTQHYSWRTEQTYVQWIKRFIFFHNKRHPLEMGGKEISQFLSALAVEKHVSASTQS